MGKKASTSQQDLTCSWKLSSLEKALLRFIRFSAGSAGFQLFSYPSPHPPPKSKKKT